MFASLIGPLELWSRDSAPVVEADGCELRLVAHGRAHAVAEAPGAPGSYLWLDVARATRRATAEPLPALLERLLQAQAGTAL